MKKAEILNLEILSFLISFLELYYFVMKILQKALVIQD